MLRTNKQISKETKKKKKEEGRNILCKQNKENRSRKTQIRVFGHEYACAYIGLAYVAQLYAYTYFEYAYAYMP